MSIPAYSIPAYMFIGDIVKLVNIPRASIFNSEFNAVVEKAKITKICFDIHKSSGRFAHLNRTYYSDCYTCLDGKQTLWVADYFATKRYGASKGTISETLQARILHDEQEEMAEQARHNQAKVSFKNLEKFFKKT